MRGSGGQKVREVMSREQLFDEDPCALWSNALVPTAITVMKLMYPCCIASSASLTETVIIFATRENTFPYRQTMNDSLYAGYTAFS